MRLENEKDNGKPRTYWLTEKQFELLEKSGFKEELLGLLGKEGEDYIIQILKTRTIYYIEKTQPPHTNREKRRKAAKELKKKNKTQNSEEPDLKINFKSKWKDIDFQ